MEENKLLKRKYIDIIACLLALMVMPLYLYGTRVLIVAAVGLITALITDFLCIRISGKKTFKKYDYSWAVTALVTVLLLPATVPYGVVVVSIVIALVVAKHPFGGVSHNTFNPAAVGVAFVAICWPQYVLRYPLPLEMYNVTDMSLIQYGVSPASVLRVGGTPKIELFDVLLGKFPGPMGTTCMIVLATCLFYLVIRKTISFRVISSALSVVLLFSIFSPRVVTGTLSSVIFELCSGGLIFGLVFMCSDPTTMPKTNNGKILYGIVLGTIVMLFRHFGAIELEFVYAILLANIFEIPCDRYALYLSEKFKKLLNSQKAKEEKSKNTDINISLTDLRGKNNA